MKDYPKHEILTAYPNGYKIYKAVSTKNDRVLKQYSEYYYIPLNNKIFKTRKEAEQYLKKIEKEQL